MRFDSTTDGFPTERREAVLTREHEERLRRAVRHLIQSARSDDQRADVGCVFDLIAYLRPEVRALVDDEAARTLSDLYGSI